MNLKEFIQNIKKNKTLITRIEKAIFLILILFLLIIIFKNINSINFNIILKQWHLSLFIMLLALIFLAVKSTMLFLIGNYYGLKKRFFHYCKVYCVSSFVEIASFTGKIGADGFKYYLWKELYWKKRVTLLATLRIAEVCGLIWILLFFFLPIYIFLPLIITIIVISILIFKNKIIESERIRDIFKENWKLLLLLSFFSAVAYGIMLSQLSIIFNAFGIIITKKILLIFFSSHILGSISQLPFGLGVKDFSIYFQLRNLLAKNEIILALFWVRLCSEFLIVILGAFFILYKFFFQKNLSSDLKREKHH